MSKRFGGKFSPTPGEQQDSTPRGSFQNARVDPAGARSNLLFLPPVLLGAFSINDGAIGLAIGLVGAAILLLAAWLLRDGLRAQAAYDARKVARRPALPRKILASILTGIGVGLAAYKSDPGLLAPVIFGLAATGLHSASFGLDPLSDKGIEGIDSFQQDRVARVVDEAERHLRAMTDAIKRAGDRQMEARVERFQDTAREMFRTVEEDPRDLSGARRYLGVYLLGAKDATAKFADIYARTRDAKARADYAALLDDLERGFSARTRKMLLEDRSDLTVEIDVLRERLEREGVHL
ncbi:MAG: 5-bromo-4-chloroindolyl phosphate hydrolysis family protein [Aestuariivita sp.]|uniref:5-bromo-4-chloroindolyl phosphate hydrolysis family protein n=1 Tax=Aestuariivita sp. TaxID=1872407 RepID=UPI003BB08659